MPSFPKLKLKGPHGEEIHDLEESRKLFSTFGVLVMVEGQAVNSYDELVKLATQDSYKDKEFLEVTLTPFIEGA